MTGALQLPDGYTALRPAPGDIERVWQLIRACEDADEGAAELTLDDQRGSWDRARFDLAADAWLIEADDGTVAAYGDVWPREGYTVILADGHVHPAHRRRGIGRWLVRTLESRAREIAANAAPGERVVLQTICFHEATDARELFESEGYEIGRIFWRMVIDIDTPPEEPRWPEGVTPRAYRPGDERAIHEVVMSAFADNAGHQFSPFDEWRGFMMNRETFNPDLWFLAEADGRVVAVALCPDYAENGAWLRQFAVAREYRGRGIAGALLRHAFRRQYQHGNRSVGLVVDSYNRTGARRVYERAGMRLDRQHDTHEKVLTAQHPA